MDKKEVIKLFEGVIPELDRHTCNTLIKRINERRIESEVEMDSIRFKEVTPDTVLGECDISVRLHNIIHTVTYNYRQEKQKHVSDFSISEFANFSEKDFQCRNFGKVSRNELHSLLRAAGIEFKKGIV